jgi:hypothetical protein
MRSLSLQTYDIVHLYPIIFEVPKSIEGVVGPWRANYPITLHFLFWLLGLTIIIYHGFLTLGMQ